MNVCQELTYAQVRELAIARYVDDNKISIGVWAKQNGYIKKKRQKDNRVYTVYIKMNNGNSSDKNRHKAQRKAKFYINKCRSASCMQGGLKQASA